MEFNRVAWVVFAFGTAVLSLIVITTMEAEEPLLPSRQYGVDVEFDVSPEKGTYTCTAVVSGFENGEVVAARRITARIGEEAVAASGMHAADTRFELRLTFFADTNNATYMLEALRAGNIVAKQRSSVKL